MREVEIKDVKGQGIQIGDIIFRAKFSGLSIHRVLKITKKSLVISICRGFREYGIEPNLRRYYFVKDTRTIESLEEHNDVMYVTRYTTQWGLIKY